MNTPESIEPPVQPNSTLKPTSGGLLRLENALMEWWISRCPSSWSMAEHLADPTVNCVTRYEKALATELASLVAVRLNVSQPIAVKNLVSSDPVPSKVGSPVVWRNDSAGTVLVHSNGRWQTRTCKAPLETTLCEGWCGNLLCLAGDG
jgi:hypothetical protein